MRVRRLVVHVGRFLVGVGILLGVGEDWLADGNGVWVVGHLGVALVFELFVVLLAHLFKFSEIIIHLIHRLRTIHSYC